MINSGRSLPRYHALILCNGEPPAGPLCRRLARAADLIVAADGGANTARTLGIQPDVIIGDLDSVSQSTLRFFSTARTLRVRRQDNTDLEKALDYLTQRGTTNVSILGATGGRIDFTLGNLSVMFNYLSSFAITVYGNNWKAIPVLGKVREDAQKGAIVSLMPFGSCSGVSITGVKYPLHRATMKAGMIGVSNVVLRPRCTVQVQKGRMLLIVFDKPLRSSR